MPSSQTGEAFPRVVIDAELKDARWNLTDGRSARFEYVLPAETKADYVLCDRHGRTLAVIEVKRMTSDLLTARQQAVGYATQLKVPLIFLANGREMFFWDHESEAHPHAVKTFFSRADLDGERRRRVCLCRDQSGAGLHCSHCRTETWQTTLDMN